jgi:hypothetical protein
MLRVICSVFHLCFLLLLYFIKHKYNTENL